MTRSTRFTAFLLAGAASLAFTGCRSHTTIVEPTKTVEQPVAVPTPVPERHDLDHHDVDRHDLDRRDDHHVPPPPPPDRRNDHR